MDEDRKYRYKNSTVDALKMETLDLIPYSCGFDRGLLSPPLLESQSCAQNLKMLFQASGGKLVCCLSAAKALQRTAAVGMLNPTRWRGGEEGSANNGNGGIWENKLSSSILKSFSLLQLCSSVSFCCSTLCVWVWAYVPFLVLDALQVFRVHFYFYLVLQISYFHSLPLTAF